MSVDIKVKVHRPKIKFTVPTNDKTFWGAVMIDTATGIVKRTQAGVDSDRKRFKEYKPSTKKSREKGYGKGKGSLEVSFVNLTATGKMLAAILRGVRAKINGGVIKLTGQEANKAFYNEQLGRDFFAIDDNQADNVLKRAIAWTRRKNKMK